MKQNSRNRTPPANAHWLGVEIRAIREERNISQTQLARLSNTSFQTVANLELGKSGTSIRLTERIITVLGYELDIHPIGTQRKIP
jgi:transcriptional regulator with XRE-family HTH domain